MSVVYEKQGRKETQVRLPGASQRRELVPQQSYMKNNFTTKDCKMSKTMSTTAWINLKSNYILIAFILWLPYWRVSTMGVTHYIILPLLITYTVDSRGDKKHLMASNILVEPTEKLDFNFFHPWKCRQSSTTCNTSLYMYQLKSLIFGYVKLRLPLKNLNYILAC